MSEIILELKGVTKRFDNRYIFKDTNLQVKKGEILGIAGRKKSGKSTILSIMGGLYGYDEGSIELNGEPFYHKKNIQLEKIGISILKDNLGLIGSLTVFENIFFGREETKAGFINRKSMIKDAVEVLKEFNSSIDPKAFVKDLDAEDRFVVALARELSKKPKIFIVDCPKIFDFIPEDSIYLEIIRKMNKLGCTIIISMNDIEKTVDFCDRVIIIKNKKLQEIKIKETKTIVEELIENNEIFENRKESRENQEIFSVDINSGQLKGMSLKFLNKEVAGFYSLSLMGEEELKNLLYEKGNKDEKLTYLGKDLKLKRSNAKKRKTILPENWVRTAFKKSKSEYPEEDYKKPSPSRLAILEIDKKESKKLKGKFFLSEIKNLFDMESQLLSFEGTYESLGDWLKKRSSLLILDNSIKDLYDDQIERLEKCIFDAKERGASIIVFSDDIDELFKFCDYIYILRYGKIKAFLKREEFSEKKILKIAYGIEQE